MNKLIGRSIYCGLIVILVTVNSMNQAVHAAATASEAESKVSIRFTGELPLDQGNSQILPQTNEIPQPLLSCLGIMVCSLALYKITQDKKRRKLYENE